jgi:hypothetical protein
MADDPRPIHLPSPAIEARCNDDRGCAVTEDGRLFCFEAERSAAGCTADFQEVPGINDASAVSLTMDEVCVLHRDGSVDCVKSEAGSLRPDLRALTKVEGLSGIVQLQSSRIATCGLAVSGQLSCWGLSECGSLGLSEGCGFTQVPAPIAVQQDIQTRLFGLADGLSCALDASDHVWCWGYSNWNGVAEGSPLPRRIEF